MPSLIPHGSGSIFAEAESVYKATQAGSASGA